MTLDIDYQPQGTLTPDFELSKLSWLKVGGPAGHLFQPQNRADLAAFLRAYQGPIFPIGVCSNLIIRDGGIDGVVIKLGRGFNAIDALGNNRIRVGAAGLDAHVARRAADWGLDLTFLRTIPGAIGGAVTMNAGCYGRYVSDYIEEIEVMHRDGRIETLAADALHFSYRSAKIPQDAVILSAVFRAETGVPEDLHALMEAQLEKRAETQPIKELSCGSTFRNPAGFSSTGQDDDPMDLKAWKLIEEAGMKGASLGGAQMSEMHANFMINKGGATAQDLESLGESVRKKVYETHKIDLQWEIKRVGKPLQK